MYNKYFQRSMDTPKKLHEWIQKLMRSFQAYFFANIFTVKANLGGGFKYFFIFSSLPGEMIQFDEHIFQTG